MFHGGKVLISSSVPPPRLASTAQSPFLVNTINSWWFVSRRGRNNAIPECVGPAGNRTLGVFHPPVSPTDARRSSTVGSTILAWILYAFSLHSTGMHRFSKCIRSACKGQLQRKESECECGSRTQRGNVWNVRGKGSWSWMRSSERDSDIEIYLRCTE